VTLLLPRAAGAQQPGAGATSTIAGCRSGGAALLPAIAVIASIWCRARPLLRRGKKYVAWRSGLAAVPRAAPEWRQLTDRYRDLAWRVARRVSVGERRDTVFEYYEALAQYSASGAWDATPAQDGLQPEQDTATFNGQLWALARGLFFGGQDFAPGSAQYETALLYYRTNGIQPAYAWAWGGSSLEQQVFADLIEDSDDAYRSSTRMLGLILDNHVASAVDALITARLRTIAPASSGQLMPEPGRQSAPGANQLLSRMPGADRTGIDRRLPAQPCGTPAPARELADSLGVAAPDLAEFRALLQQLEDAGVLYR
jgi:hypothetical protein